jgi:hypothetical protein
MAPATFTRVLAITCCMLLTGITAGCSRPGPTRYSLKGNASFKGKPVPAGRVMLAPDGTQGNRGPAAYAQIIDGRFITETGKGHVGGPHLVEIQGFDTTAGTEPPPSLFPIYETVVDLPKADSIMDFEVPTPAPRQPASRRAN